MGAGLAANGWQQCYLHLRFAEDRGMLYLIVKAALSGIIIAAASEVRRSSR